MAVIEISDARFVCQLAAETEPAVQVRPGSTLRVRCRHACDRLVGEGPGRAEAPNPATGPIAVAGARPGQALRIDVLDIEPDPVGHVAASPDGGMRAVPIQDGLAMFDEAIRIPIAPMIGVLGVAPAEGSWPTMGCGPYGGNLDTNDIAPGATVYLPVFRPGGLLVLGDVHAVMGDGEIGGQGLEVAATVTLRVDVEPEPLSDAVYLVRDDALMVLGTGETLAEACDQAVEAMAALIARHGSMDAFAARKLLGLAGHLRIGQQCCPIKSARVAVPLACLPGLAPTPERA